MIEHYQLLLKFLILGLVKIEKFYIFQVPFPFLFSWTIK